MFADIIVDISHENLDKTFQYAIPAEMLEKAVVGAPVMIPFGKGNRLIKGYITGLSEKAKIDESRIKPIASVEEKGLVMESRTIELAEKMRSLYGGTMNDALRTVTPVKQTVKPVVSKTVVLKDRDLAARLLVEARQKNHRAKVRFLTELLQSGSADYELLVGKLNIARKTVSDFEELGVTEVIETRQFRGGAAVQKQENGIVLNEEQQAAVDTVTGDLKNGIKGVYLLKGVTGSGKTEVYMSVIEEVVRQGRQAIMLIPEIALTYQTVSRFSKRFGDRVSFMHSRLSDGEKYDQYLRAKEGGTDIMIGPRSALFTPFKDPGLIIIDEEHESSYKSENVPKYHARELAIEYAKMVGASVILGSATPSTESYYRAKRGEDRLLELKNRAGNASLPKVHITDMREELKAGNMSMFSRKLKSLIEDRLMKKQQIMLFINRRGYAGFVSCRACGTAMRCPHCEVSLTAHMVGNRPERLVCHYCGYEIPMPKTCPECGSKYIAAFGTGTQKVEEYVKKVFPTARVLRMDADTTKDKQGHERVLSAFSNDEADILVGTQMIVKGHDFPNVTLVGAIAADISLNAADCRGAERSFQLLAQAAGRAGRGDKPGEVVIQTYRPEHYALRYAAAQDYESFYKEEIAYRELADYPPASHLLLLQFFSKSEEDGMERAKVLKEELKKRMGEDAPEILGPAAACLGKLRDVCRTGMYLRHKERKVLERAAEEAWALQEELKLKEGSREVLLQFDPDPVSMF